MSPDENLNALPERKRLPRLPTLDEILASDPGPHPRVLVTPDDLILAGCGTAYDCVRNRFVTLLYPTTESAWGHRPTVDATREDRDGIQLTVHMPGGRTDRIDWAYGADGVVSVKSCRELPE